MILLARLCSGKCMVGGNLSLPPHARTCPTPFHVHSNHLGWKDSWVRIICHTHVSFATVSFRATKLVQRCSEQHSGLYQSFYRRSIASPSCVWCQHLFALSKAARTGKSQSSGEKAGDCSCSCIPTKAGQAYPCGGLHKVLFAVTHTYFTICVTCFGTISRFFFVLLPCLSRQCLTGFIPEAVLKRSRDKFLNFPTRSQRKSYITNLRTPKSRYGTPLLVSVSCIFIPSNLWHSLL